MLVVEVDLVRDAVQRERHRLLGRATVEIVDEEDLNLLSHKGTSRFLHCRNIASTDLKMMPPTVRDVKDDAQALRGFPTEENARATRLPLGEPGMKMFIE
ncbi:hypothetical protein GCM10025864_06650 [Luteimicrobium album]|uniref:Uncharacterized protein n=1 Tax=Luteimicrobium album TaxID=1054550 RepID=A0ABQ6HY06_9MICO|nr:hypothetical protein GCM10025864_06650 [Luteimicrobium album]